MVGRTSPYIVHDLPSVSFADFSTASMACSFGRPLSSWYSVLSLWSSFVSFPCLLDVSSSSICLMSVLKVELRERYFLWHRRCSLSGPRTMSRSQGRPALCCKGQCWYYRLWNRWIYIEVYCLGSMLIYAWVCVVILGDSQDGTLFNGLKALKRSSKITRLVGMPAQFGFCAFIRSRFRGFVVELSSTW